MVRKASNEIKLFISNDESSRNEDNWVVIKTRQANKSKLNLIQNKEVRFVLLTIVRSLIRSNYLKGKANKIESYCKRRDNQSGNV